MDEIGKDHVSGRYCRRVRESPEGVYRHAARGEYGQTAGQGVDGMRIAIAAVVLWSAGSALTAADWDEWRGPHRDGTLIAEPKAWPEKLNQKWKITVGEGHSSPILAAGSIYVFARQEGQETVLAIDPSSGKVRWQQQYPAPYKMNPAAT